MKIRTLSLTLLLAGASAAWAQTALQTPETTAVRPLNLSVRKAQTPDAATAQPVQERQNRRLESAADKRAGDVLEELPYGAGYDSRQRGAANGAGAGSGGGGGGGGGGSGGGGGRGRR